MEMDDDCYLAAGRGRPETPQWKYTVKEELEREEDTDVTKSSYTESSDSLSSISYTEQTINELCHGGVLSPEKRLLKLQVSRMASAEGFKPRLWERDEDESDVDITESSYSGFMESFSSLGTVAIKEVDPIQTTLEDTHWNTARSYHSQEIKQSRPSVVRFDASPHYGWSASTRSDASRLWYSVDDYDGFKKENAATLSRLIRGKEESTLKCLRILKRIYKRPREPLYQSNPSREETNHVQLLDQMYQLLTAEELIGLETYVIRCRVKDGRKVRLGMMAEKIELYRAENSASAVMAWLDPETRAEELRKACMEISRPSRMFAINLALAKANQL
eukprot:CAMPEP_0172442948 /NCGR_PEP_ID=MMETSP1065-20121228/3280_1 /TAXON_ID=265537 /ORGANISM="Amphiprora paludosa, Strain CCMP125" /LENGTH=332 /DNA_ID=CAMNT_0013192995 /DNA_START=111 /DNA_END=1109 /DNA_ORIENTATION=-